VGRWYRGGTRFSRPAFSETLAFNTYFFPGEKSLKLTEISGFVKYWEFSPQFYLEKNFQIGRRSADLLLIERKSSIGFLVFTWLVGVDGNAPPHREPITDNLPLDSRR
jgi:hypothetical protein